MRADADILASSAREGIARRNSVLPKTEVAEPAPTAYLNWKRQLILRKARSFAASFDISSEFIYRCDDGMHSDGLTILIFMSLPRSLLLLRALGRRNIGCEELRRLPKHHRPTSLPSALVLDFRHCVATSLTLLQINAFPSTLPFRQLAATVFTDAQYP